MTEKHTGGRPIQAHVSMCEYRPKGVECSMWMRNCTNCGWNPDVEMERKRKMRRGEVDFYLKLDYSRIKNEGMAEFRKHKKDGDL